MSIRETLPAGAGTLLTASTRRFGNGGSTTVRSNRVLSKSLVSNTGMPVHHRQPVHPCP
jgi:hypothetical protein